MKRRITSTLKAQCNAIAERFAALTQVAYDGVLIYHAGVILDATPGAAALFGRAPQELDHCAVEKLVAFECHPVLKHLGSTVRRTCPAMAVRGDGSRLPIELSVQASLTLNGRQLQVIALRDASSDDLGFYRTDQVLARSRNVAVAHN
jgi:PAS domain-containing protein